MTHTVTEKERTVMGNKTVIVASVDVTSYTTGGEVLTGSEFALQSIDSLEVIGNEEPATQLVIPEVDASGDYAGKSTVHLFAVNLDGTNAETTATTNIGAIRVRVEGVRE